MTQVFIRQGHTYRDTEEGVSDHDLELRSADIPDRCVSVLPKVPNDGRNVALPAPRLVQELEDVDHSPNLVRYEADQVERARDVVSMCPVRVAPPTRVIVPILRAWSAVKIEYDMNAVFACPAEGAEEVGSGPRDVRVDERRVVGVRGGDRNGPIPNLHPGRECKKGDKEFLETEGIVGSS